jgi:hypothetical protein
VLDAITLTVIGIVLLLAGVVAAVPLVRGMRRKALRRAVQQFRLHRETLEAKFFDLAAAGGKPRGLRWVECDWQSAVTFARDLRTGLLTAFVSVEVHFEAVEGGDMEDVAAVGTIRDASAVFHYQSGRWGTGGKALFNMNPAEAVERLQGQFAPVEVEQGNMPPFRP